MREKGEAPPRKSTYSQEANQGAVDGVSKQELTASETRCWNVGKC